MHSSGGLARLALEGTTQFHKRQETHLRSIDVELVGMHLDQPGGGPVQEQISGDITKNALCEEQNVQERIGQLVKRGPAEHSSHNKYSLEKGHVCLILYPLMDQSSVLVGLLDCESRYWVSDLVVLFENARQLVLGDRFRIVKEIGQFNSREYCHIGALSSERNHL